MAKRCDTPTLTNEQIQHIMDRLNNQPRKSLGFLSHFSEDVRCCRQKYIYWLRCVFKQLGYATDAQIIIKHFTVVMPKKL